MCSMRYELTLYLIIYIYFSLERAILQLLVAVFLSRKSMFSPWRVHVKFVIVKVARGDLYFRVLLFSSVSIISPISQIHLYRQAAFARRIKGLSLGTFKKV